MTTHLSATQREESSNNTNASLKSKDSMRSDASLNTNAPSKSSVSAKSNFSPKSISHNELDPSIKRRARLLATRSSIPHQTRALIRYGLQVKDPYLAQIVRRVEAGELEIHRLHTE
jgi:hypothetical protein